MGKTDCLFTESESLHLANAICYLLSGFAQSLESPTWAVIVAQETRQRIVKRIQLLFSASTKNCARALKTRHRAGKITASVLPVRYISESWRDLISIAFLSISECIAENARNFSGIFCRSLVHRNFLFFLIACSWRTRDDKPRPHGRNNIFSDSCNMYALPWLLLLCQVCRGFTGRDVVHPGRTDLFELSVIHWNDFHARWAIVNSRAMSTRFNRLYRRIAKSRIREQL